MEKNEKALVSEFNQIFEEKGFDQAYKNLGERVRNTEQLVDLKYEINAFQHEGAYAIYEAVEKIYGKFDLTSTEGASGDRVPELISITLPDGSEVKAPWGRIALPNFDKDSYIELDYDWDDTKIIVYGRIRRKFEDEVKKIVDEANALLAEKSIYKGQAITIEFDDSDEAEEPEFMDLNIIDSNKILFSKAINDGLVPIMARITDSEKCINENLDLKLGVLMEGPYGTGKTLTAFHIAKVAVQHGWTFIYLKDCTHMAKTLKIAENYARKNNGVVIFTEDIDQVLRGERGKKIQDIVNTLDGGDTKNLPIISIFTTNHIELIEPTFLRGKRIGSLINFGVLDMDTAQQFIDKLVVNSKGEKLMEEGDTTPAAEALCGIVPAFASEVIDKAKAYMITRKAEKISNEDIVLAADSYKRQMTYAQCKVHEKNDLAEALKTVFGAAGEAGGNMDKKFLEVLGDRLGLKKTDYTG